MQTFFDFISTPNRLFKKNVLELFSESTQWLSAIKDSSPYYKLFSCVIPQGSDTKEELITKLSKHKLSMGDNPVQFNVVDSIEEGITLYKDIDIVCINQLHKHINQLSLPLFLNQLLPILSEKKSIALYFTGVDTNILPMSLFQSWADECRISGIDVTEIICTVGLSGNQPTGMSEYKDAIEQYGVNAVPAVFNQNENMHVYDIGMTLYKNPIWKI